MLQTILASDCITYDASYDLVLAASRPWSWPLASIPWSWPRVLGLSVLVADLNVMSSHVLLPVVQVFN